jgi:mRNA interferase RelE/StbE
MIRRYESGEFEIEFASSFSKRMRMLNKETQVRILRELDVLRANPYAGKPLRGEWKGVFSLRIGDYRVLYQIKKDKVILLAVGHRKHIY